MVVRTPSKPPRLGVQVECTFRSVSDPLGPTKYYVRVLVSLRLHLIGDGVERFDPTDIVGALTRVRKPLWFWSIAWSAVPQGLS